MLEGVIDVSEITGSLNEMSKHLSRIAENINSQISRFKTESAAKEAEEDAAEAVLV